jgi:hypothetical protein
MSSSSEEASRRSSEVNESTSPPSPSSKAQAAWNTVKSNLNFKARSSMPNMRRWLSLSRATESGSSDAGSLPDAQRQSEDRKESFFCESMLGLMQQTGRFDYIDFNPERQQNNIDAAGEEGETTNKDPRAKRFSWSR